MRVRSSPGDGLADYAGQQVEGAEPIFFQTQIFQHTVFTQEQITNTFIGLKVSSRTSTRGPAGEDTDPGDRTGWSR